MIIAHTCACCGKTTVARVRLTFRMWLADLWDRLRWRYGRNLDRSRKTRGR